MYETCENEMIKDLHKVRAVIYSCQSEEQLEVAEAMVDLFCKKHSVYRCAEFLYASISAMRKKGIYDNRQLSFNF